MSRAAPHLLGRHARAAAAGVSVLLVLLVAGHANAREQGVEASPGKAAVWFAPLPPMPTYEGRPYIGSTDFMRLFSTKAPWRNAAKRVAVFKLYGEWVHGVATDAQLRKVVTDLRRRKIALALETGPLDPTTECGEGIEGFATIASGLEMARRVKAAGGELRYIALDEPFFYGSLYGGPRACRWDVERIARGVHAFVKAVRRVFPRVAVGDTEPITAMSDVSAYVRWLDAYRGVSGEKLAFLHLDMSYGLPGWEEMARTLEAAARQRGVALGVIVFGEPRDGSDAAWVARARGRIEQYEVEAGGAPDHVLFQSWQDRPDRTLPETNPATFTGLVRTYARPRTRLTLALEREGGGGTVAAGRLLTQAGKPVGGARVSVAAALPVAGAQPLELTSTTTTTDAQGAFRARLSGVPTTGFELTARYAGTASLWPARATIREGGVLSNLALGRPASAQGSIPETPPALAVDGDGGTAWISGGGPPMWFEVDLGAPARVVEVRLHVAQTPNGPTAHRVLALTPSGWVTVADLVGETSDGQILVSRPPAPVEDARAVRVETSASPSWVAWREVQVIGTR